jgi:hypothetical protein
MLKHQDMKNLLLTYFSRLIERKRLNEAVASLPPIPMSSLIIAHPTLRLVAKTPPGVNIDYTIRATTPMGLAKNCSRWNWMVVMLVHMFPQQPHPRRIVRSQLFPKSLRLAAQ